MSSKITTSGSIEDYIAELQGDVQSGLMSTAELEEVVAFLKGDKPKSGRVALEFIVVENNDFSQDRILGWLSNLYYREIFGKLPSAEKEVVQDTAVLAMHEGTPVGAVWVISSPTPAYQNLIYVDRLYVKEDYRSNGKVGSQLLDVVLNLAPERCNGLVLHAWSNAVPFYQRCGFLSYDEPEQIDDEIFYRMILPLNKATFDSFVREKEVEIFEGLEEVLTPRQWGLFVDAVSNLTGDYDDLPPSKNPFTIFLYKTLGYQHDLLEFNQDQK
ncbi:hypothetical protein COY27_06965 [Candidatus Woesearchaeota archaeon CG_4_10_14_0_2_um_filter_33_13]|nr:MAG: hypothetical protein COY27_06965 [Candidatus Woesearchaeota archaeon CG_4_10_14_0_2_um_filter_33_13]